MVGFGNVFQNIITLAVLIGFGYIVYQKIRGKKSGLSMLFTKDNLKGGKNFQ